jgi:hypothetical protein
MEEELSGGDAEQLSDDMIHMMSDSEALNQHLEGSRENVDAKINDMESLIVKELLRDWKNTETRILEHQHHRNRTIVQEVIGTCEKFRKEISKFYIDHSNVNCRGGDRRYREGQGKHVMIKTGNRHTIDTTTRILHFIHFFFT